MSFWFGTFTKDFWTTRSLVGQNATCIFSYFHTLRVCTIPTYTESTDSTITINSDGHHQISLLHVQRPGNIDSEVSETSSTYNFSIIYWRRLLIRSWLDAIPESEWTNFCSFLQQSAHYFHIALITSWVKGGGLQMIRFGRAKVGFVNPSATSSMPPMYDITSSALFCTYS